MLGKPKQLEPKLFYGAFSLEQRVHKDNPLRKVKKLIDFSFIRSEVKDLYGSRGNPSVDPAVILKLMFLLFYENVKSERALANQLPSRLDWLWFCDYDIDDQTPNHSVISKARQRWGVDVFIKFFQNILQQCIDAGLVEGSIVHIDSSTIKANASKDKTTANLKIVSEDLYNQLEQDTEDEAKTAKRVNKTDPDAGFGKKKGSPAVLGYKDHRVVDDKHGIVTATITTAANVKDASVLKDAIKKSIANTNYKPNAAVADTGYGFEDNFKYLHDNQMQSCIAQRGFGNIKCQDFSRDHFIYDADEDCFTCPAGQKLFRFALAQRHGVVKYRAKREVCQNCEYADKCLRSTKHGRIVARKIGIDYRHWARNCMSETKRLALLTRRKHKIEGSFADAANNHGFKRMRFRGLEKATIQNLMIAAIQNLRKFIKAHSLKPTAALACQTVSTILAAIFSRFARSQASLAVKLSEYLIFKELFQRFRYKQLYCKSFQ